ncbi:MAG: hypothetical protein LBC61_03800 [Candidatus Peribacteria bacterium]|nr:hypothetical protein [Candidatus Peribacteria bacterium]
MFLALLPLIFVFLPFKRKYYFLAFVFIALIQFLFYATPNSKFIDSSSLTGFDSKVLE